MSVPIISACENPDELADVLHTHPDIRHVISGHVHLTSCGSYRGLPFTTIAGNHYNILPMPTGPNPVPRLEGPGQYAVVMSDEKSTVILFEDFINRHIVMAPELFNFG